MSVPASIAEQTAFISFVLGWDGGVFPVYLDGRPQPSAFIDAHDAKKLADRAAHWDFDRNAQVEIGLPESKPNNGGAHSATALWCWCESRDQVRRVAKRFKPTPPLVLRIGLSCRRLCVWPLKERIPYLLIEPANRRISYALHAPQKAAAPEKLRLPLPGTFIRVGRKRPAPVTVTRMELEAFSRSQVVAGLREPPPPWSQRMRESGAWR